MPPPLRDLGQKCSKVKVSRVQELMILYNPYWNGNRSFSIRGVGPAGLRRPTSEGPRSSLQVNILKKVKESTPTPVVWSLRSGKCPSGYRGVWRVGTKPHGRRHQKPGGTARR